MRQPADNCLLCGANPAVKTNSHILSRFISTAFLGKGPRRGYSLGSFQLIKSEGGGVSIRKPQIIQDSPKENYILCEDCEAYFGVIEGFVRDSFILWREKVRTGEFNITPVADDIWIVECLTINPRTVRLFVYSLFWRASISAHDMFEGYELSDEIQEALRGILLSYKGTRTEYLTRIDDNPDFKDFPFAVVTTERFEDDSANFIFAPQNAEPPYSLVVDRFGFLLLENDEGADANPIVFYSNRFPDDCVFMIISQALWDPIFVQAPVELLLKDAKRNA